MTATLRYLSAIFLIGISGCGLGDYQRRMDEQRARIKEFDDTNNLLDDPIEIPIMETADKKEAPAWVIDFYLRLPRGCGTVVKDRTPYFAPLPFFRYGGPDPAYNYFVCGAGLLEPKSKAEYDRYPMKDFRSYSVSAIQDFCAKTYKINLPLKLPEKSLPRKLVTPFAPLTSMSGAAEPVGYDEIVFQTTGKDASYFKVYFHEEQGKQVCIVGQRPLSVPADSAFEKAVEACLGTLDMTSDAPARRQQFKERKR